ncbi:MAG: Lumazine synthase [Candidatus Tokpelaia hoelldobleri]|uniref:6,7-dimethyl-8-ribityllumazine synthase n=1 Tax=Candidatus Tokpelaia hoelldobleri TaxID=1902579 RepID=A0A1U9JUC6_9HYPH|nr:MAG: Lumazine synthase [Candidatus Tokpelaia hoelldoblerii]
MSHNPSRAQHLLIVEARFYDDLADALLAGTKAALDEAGASYDVVTVPGALEIPAAIAFAAQGKSKHYDGYVALGCVIRGETYHFDVVADESCRGITDLALQKSLAIGNGILTVEDESQAWARVQVGKGEKDKGGFAAHAALRMIALQKEFGVKP